MILISNQGFLNVSRYNLKRNTLAIIAIMEGERGEWGGWGEGFGFLDIDVNRP